MKKRIAILGASGSIGTSALWVVERFSDRLELVGISVHRNLHSAQEVVRRFPSCEWVVVTGLEGEEMREDGVRFLYGRHHLEPLIRDTGIDVVVFALPSGEVVDLFLALVESGVKIAMANKEALVVTCDLIKPAVAKNVLPIDSEQSALWQLLEGRGDEIKRVILTCSGGPFRGRKREELREVDASSALAHPRWNMGPKVSLDSATLMNKALEVIEAVALFDLDPDQIEVLVHPQAEVHGIVEMVDGSLFLQAGITDMRLPIQYALSWPERWDNDSLLLPMDKGISWDFQPVDHETFTSLKTGRLALEKGGSALVVFNTANDLLGKMFLDGEIGFLDILDLTQRLVEEHHPWRIEGLEDIKKAKTWVEERLSTLLG